MRQLYCSNVKIEYLKMPSQISNDEIKIIDTKSGHSRKRIFLMTAGIVLLCGAVYSLFFVKEMFICFCMLTAFILALLIPCLKHWKIYACHAVVTDKKERRAKVSGRNDPQVMPYSKTESTAPSKPKTHLFYSLKSYFFCTVRINGEIFENVCCFTEDYDKIAVGDTVIIGENTGIPIIYSISELSMREGQKNEASMHRY